MGSSSRDEAIALALAGSVFLAEFSLADVIGNSADTMAICACGYEEGLLTSTVDVRLSGTTTCTEILPVDTEVRVQRVAKRVSKIAAAGTRSMVQGLIGIRTSGFRLITDTIANGVTERPESVEDFVTSLLVQSTGTVANG